LFVGADPAGRPESVKHQIGRPSNRPTIKSGDHQIGRPSNRATIKSGDHQIGRPSNRPTIKSADHQIGRPSNRPTIKSGDPAGRPYRSKLQHYCRFTMGSLQQKRLIFAENAIFFWHGICSLFISCFYRLLF